VVSSFETFHFSKPNPAYLAEVLGRIGWPEGPVLVVGDDAELDMLAAQGLGLPMFWIADEDTALPAGRKPVAARGGIGDVRPWLESVDLTTLVPRYQTPDAVVATAKGVTAALRTLLADVPTALWRRHPEPQAWSLVEVVAHLRDVEREVNQVRIRTFLQEKEPFIKADDTDVWASERRYIDEDGAAALGEFLSARMETLSMLAALADDDWQRSGRHAIFGPLTLQEQLGFMAEHDRVHLRQICGLLRQGMR
jgi:hypothetical protein